MNTNRTRPFPSDSLVRWNPTMRPTHAVDVVGRVFISDKRVTSVLFDGSDRLSMIATSALVRVTSW